MFGEIWVRPRTYRFSLKHQLWLACPRRGQLCQDHIDVVLSDLRMGFVKLCEK
jgi:hypothetical protein